MPLTCPYLLVLVGNVQEHVLDVTGLTVGLGQRVLLPCLTFRAFTFAVAQPFVIQIIIKDLPSILHIASTI